MPAYINDLRRREREKLRETYVEHRHREREPVRCLINVPRGELAGLDISNRDPASADRQVTNISMKGILILK